MRRTREAHSPEPHYKTETIIGLQNTSLVPTPPHHIAKVLFTSVPFTQYIMASQQEKIMRHTKRQKQFEESEQTSEPDTDMIGMLNLPAWEFKITMINMIRALVNKRDRMQEQMVSVNRETEMLRKNQKQLLEIKKKHYNRIKECL